MTDAATEGGNSYIVNCVIRVRREEDSVRLSRSYSKELFNFDDPSGLARVGLDGYLIAPIESAWENIELPPFWKMLRRYVMGKWRPWLSRRKHRYD